MSRKSKLFKSAAVPIVVIAAAVALHARMMAATPRPPASEFGYGPRVSAMGTFNAVIEDSASIGKGRMLKPVVVRISDIGGQGIDGLQIRVDGGMPQHGHGLPTRPRVTQSLGNGRYQIDGLKFNMGGWWELKLITAGASADSVVFNLSL